MFKYAAITDMGPSASVNDDRVLVDNIIISSGEIEGTVNENYLFVAVADGVGGLLRGYEAAEMTLETLKPLNQAGMQRTDLRRNIESANQRVILDQNESGLENGMRTTLAALYIDEQSAYIINAGDSRVYRFRNDQVEQLSKDHSVVQNLLDTGEITLEESFSHPKRNIITKCIGEEDRVNARIIDYSEGIHNDDVYVLCSDGISDCIRNEEIKTILSNNKEKALKDICREFIKRALDNGSTDNISICLMRKEN